MQRQHLEVTTDDRATITGFVEGSGPTNLLIIPGWATTAEYFDHLISHLDLARFRVCAIDLRGHGRSTLGDEPLSIARYSRDVQAFRKAAGIERYVAVGHSLGGKIATHLGAVADDRLAGLVLLAPVPPGAVPGREEEVREAAGLAGDVVRLTEAHRVYATSAPVAEEIRLAWARRAAKIQRDVVLESLVAAYNEDVGGAVEAMTTPTVVIAGSDDRFLDVDLLRDLVLPRIPHAQMVVLESGHELQVERPKEVAALIKAFVAGLSPTVVGRHGPAQPVQRSREEDMEFETR
jgi:pimeloyl-ACP methyl ester carboxylesterase